MSNETMRAMRNRSEGEMHTRYLIADSAIADVTIRKKFGRMPFLFLENRLAIGLIGAYKRLKNSSISVAKVVVR